MSEVQRGAWAAFAPDVLPHLTAEDDPAFWEAALNAIFVDADALCGKVGPGLLESVTGIQLRLDHALPTATAEGATSRRKLALWADSDN